MKNLKNKNKVGRPKYLENKQLLRELFRKIDNNEITNEERLANCWLSARQNGLN